MGDCVLCSGIIAYLGVFPMSYRDTAVDAWKQLLTGLKIPYSNDFSLQRVLSDPLTIGRWTNAFKLPNDSFSVDNAIILQKSSRWPILIDPQTQANTWIKNMESGDSRDRGAEAEKKKLIVLRTSQSANEVNFKLENAIQFGMPVLLENITESIDVVYEPVLQKKIVKQGGSLKLKFGDKMIDYSPEFRFYMTTKMSRPHYSPEICIKVTLLNFQVTVEGLEDQMLNFVVKIEEPFKEEQRQKNIREQFENEREQKETEDRILKLLNESKGDLLDDEQLIVTLEQSKIKSMEISEKMNRMKHEREQLNQIRNFYREVAKRVASLYFVVLDLAMIEPTYQWSLEFYVALFEKGIDKAPSGKENRCRNIIDKFQILLYESICRALLEKDKIVFSLLMTMKVLQSEEKITADEIRFVMVGGTWTEASKPKPAAEWVSNKMWFTLCELSERQTGFRGLDQDFATNVDAWAQVYNSASPQDAEWPGRWQTGLSHFQRLIVLRIIRPDKFTTAVQNLIINEMGRQFMEPPPFNLEQTFVDSDPLTPLIFILSSGADPRIEIENMAVKLGFKNNFVTLSLGQGQGEIAERAIQDSIREGKWVLLQNCHLAPSFMPDLERIHENIPADVHRDFRLFLTSMPSNVFPVTLLMKGLKMTFEPPRGLRNNLLRS